MRYAFDGTSYLDEECMSDLGDLLAEGIAKNNPELAAEMGITPTAELGSESEPNEKQLQQVKVIYCKTVLRIAEEMFFRGRGTPVSCIQSAKEFVEAGNEFAAEVLGSGE